MKVRQLTLELPGFSIDYLSYFRKVTALFVFLKKTFVRKMGNFLLLFSGLFKRRVESDYAIHGNSPRINVPSFFNKKKKTLRNIFVVVLVVLALFLLVKYVPKNNNTMDQISNERAELKAALSMADVNREFEFPLKDNEGEEISRIKYSIEKAEMRDEIITEGKRATAVKGRLFLIIILKITNQYEKAIEINTRDYIRLSVNGKEEELLAPDTHNDPVEIQAISTKYTRLGFIVNETDKDLVLHVGEIQADKEKINLELK